MTTLTVTSRGQVTLRRDILRHLGVAPGDRIDVDLLPDAQAALRAANRRGSVTDLRGMLKSKTNGRRLSVDQIGEAIAETGASAGAGRP
jgi:bifunctional DNA-binding transcriptional regulator/antitoxin component of YhaV-PrlF toxin-antitoxin module